MERKIQGGIILTLILIVITAITAGSVGWSLANRTQGPITEMLIQSEDGRQDSMIGESLTEGVFSHGKYAGTRTKSGKNQMIFVASGREKVLDEGYACFPECTGKDQENESKFFTDFRFSPTGNYLTYVQHGWEWSPTILYDVKAGKRVGGKVDADLSNSSLMRGFTPNEKYLFLCSESGEASDVIGKVYSSGDFSVVFDVFDSSKVKGVKGFTAVECDYSEGKVNFRLRGDPNDSMRTKVVSYDLATGNVTDF